MVKKSGNNTRLYIVLGIIALAIIIGTVVGSSYRERFTNPSKEIVYLYMETCGHCKNFTPIWEQMAENNKDKFTFNKYLYCPKIYFLLILSINPLMQLITKKLKLLVH